MRRIVRFITISLFLFELIALTARPGLKKGCVNLALLREMRVMNVFPQSLNSPLQSSAGLATCQHAFGASDRTRLFLPVRAGYWPDAFTAVFVLSDFVASHPDDYWARFELVKALADTGEHARAARLYREFGRDGDEFYQLGTRMLNAGQSAKAKVYFELCAEAYPARDECWFQLGMIQFHEGDPAAQQSFSRVIELGNLPEIRATSLVMIGALLLSKGDLPGAKEKHNAALQINPQAYQAMVGLGRVALTRGDCKVAQRWADRAAELAPNDQWVLKLLQDIEDFQ